MNRGDGLFKKVNKLVTLCGEKVALIVCSPRGKVFSYGHLGVEKILEVLSVKILNFYTLFYIVLWYTFLCYIVWSLLVLYFFGTFSKWVMLWFKMWEKIWRSSNLGFAYDVAHHVREPILNFRSDFFLMLCVECCTSYAIKCASRPKR